MSISASQVNPHAPVPSSMSPAIALKLDSLNVRFPGQTDNTLSDINLKVAEGDFTAVIGTSGAGKSTLMRTICGFIPPTSGVIETFGNSQSKGRRIANELSMVFQNFHLIEEMTALDNVLIGRLAHKTGLQKTCAWFNSKDKQASIDALERVNMHEMIYRQVKTLSGGQKQRIAIARCLSQGARLLLADEPVASLDPINADNVLQLLKDLNENSGITVIANMHQVELVEKYFDNVVALRKGKISFTLSIENDSDNENGLNRITREKLHSVYR